MPAGDHSTAGAIIGGSLKRAGLGGGLIRYACGGRGDVNITPAEVRDLRANGVPIGIVLEHEADWLLRGNISARTQACLSITRACGLPDGVIYAAADFDATNGGPTSPGSPGDQNMRRILASLQEMSRVPGVGRDNVGFYGSKFGIDWLVREAPWIKWFWQTEAWSMRERSPHACLFQRAQAINVGGVSVDVDEIWKAQWGQRVHAAPPPAPKPPPPPPPKKAKGKLRFAGEFDADSQTWEIHGTNGEGVEWAGAEVWASSAIGVALGGPHAGEWAHKSLPWNAVKGD